MKVDSEDIRWVQEPRLSLADRMYLPLFLGGLTTTARHLVSPKVTVSYPDEEPQIDNPMIYRGVHRLNRDEQGRVKCVACFLCATACPAHCIDIVGVESPWPDREKYPESFTIDELRCIYCGMCEEACPVDAIELTSLYNLTGRSREEMVFDKEKLLSVYDMTKDKEPMQSGGAGRRIMIQAGLVGAVVDGGSRLSVPSSTMRLLVAAVLLTVCLWLLMPNGYSLPSLASRVGGTQRWRRPGLALDACSGSWFDVDHGRFLDLFRTDARCGAGDNLLAQPGLQRNLVCGLPAGDGGAVSVAGGPVCQHRDRGRLRGGDCRDLPVRPDAGATCRAHVLRPHQLGLHTAPGRSPSRRQLCRVACRLACPTGIPSG